MSAAPALELPTLRWYQEEAITALFDWFQREDSDPLVVLPTGAGKSLLLSAFIARVRANHPPVRTIVLATQAELVQQNAKAARLLNAYQDVGVFSAGLKSKDATRPITVANIQSIARHAYAHAFDLIIVDEAHTIADADSGQYRSFLTAQRQQNPHVKMVGLTATPYKLSSGALHEGPNALFGGIAYEAPIVQLIAEGYLTRPITPRTSLAIDTTHVTTRGGEFVQQALAQAVDVEATTQQAVEEMVRRFHDRHHWVVFAVSVDHARHIGDALAAHNIPTTVVHGELARDERAYRLEAFDRGEVRAIVNCQLLTTGWDCQKIDAIALLRPTKSAGLYVQMLGRGMRTHPSKQNCLVLDFAGCIEQFGPIDAIRTPSARSKNNEEKGDAIVKSCPVCECYVAAGLRTCTECGHEFPPPPIKLTPAPAQAPILSDDREPRWVEVSSVEYSYHEPKPPKTIPTLRVTYFEGFRIIAQEWVCLQHEGFARRKAESWWGERSPDRAPTRIDDALALVDDLRKPVAIGVVPSLHNPRYASVVGARFSSPTNDNGDLPRACWSCTRFSTLHTMCMHFNATPPLDVQQVGCEAWSDEEELPF